MRRAVRRRGYIASSYDLAWLQVTSHLRVVLRENDTPHGLLVMTGRYPYPGPNPRGNPADNSVWVRDKTHPH